MQQLYMHLNVPPMKCLRELHQPEERQCQGGREEHKGSPDLCEVSRLLIALAPASASDQGSQPSEATSAEAISLHLSLCLSLSLSFSLLLFVYHSLSLC